MQELVNKVFKEKMENGDIEAIISKKIDELVNCSLHSLFTYDGPIKKQMQEKLNECMSNVLKSTKFDEYVVKLSAVIDGCLQDTSLRDYKEIVDTIKGICGPKLDMSDRRISAEELFNKYCSYIEELEISYDDLDDDVKSEVDEGYAYLDVEMEVNEKCIILRTTGFSDSKDYCQVLCCFQCTWGTNQGNLILTGISKYKPEELEQHPYSGFICTKEIGLSELNHLNELELYLLTLTTSHFHLIPSDRCFSDQVSVKVTY